MDDEEITTVVINAQRHNRWSLLIIAANWVHEMAKVNANTAGVMLGTLIEHAAQKDIDREFKEIVK